jgi:DNA-binding XRE family transcriptional regulator
MPVASAANTVDPAKAPQPERVISLPSPAQPAAVPRPVLTGADLADFRRRAALTQVAAAKRLGVTQGTISKAEGNPRAALGQALADALQRVAG